MKRLFAILTCITLLLVCATPIYAAEGTAKNIGASVDVHRVDYVVDDADLLDDDEEAMLSDSLQSKSDELDFDIVVVTVDTLEGKTPEAFADDYYDYNGYGRGESHDGCLLLVSMEDRDWHISTTGFGITALTDAGIDYISGCFLSDLSDGYYYLAFCEFADKVEDFVNEAYIGDPYDIDNLESYDYNYEDVMNSGDDEMSLAESAGVGVIVGLIVALIVISVLKGQLKTVRHKAQANDYLVEGSLVITSGHDEFITTSVSKVKRESDSNGGSSTHTGSSGTSHGGGGGKF